MAIHKPVIYKKQLIGQIFLRRGLINKEQLRESLELQKKKGGFLGELLVGLGYLTARDLIMGLSAQCNIPFLPPARYKIKKDIVKIIPKELAFTEHVICIDKFKDVITVVMADPLNEKVIDKIMKLSGYSLGICIATAQEIDEALKKYY